MPDDLPPPVAKKIDPWEAYLLRAPVATMALNQWRYNRYNAAMLPMVFKQRFGMYHEPFPVEVPHPQHREYSSIETAKRKKIEAMREAKINNYRREISHNKPQRHIPDMIFRPRETLPNFNRIMRIRLPRGLM